MRKEARVRQLIRRFIRDDSGATAIEYGMILALMFLVILGALLILSALFFKRGVHGAIESQIRRRVRRRRRPR